MAKRQVFFSFRFLYDAWRVSQIRNMGKISDDSTFSDNDWETVRSNSPDVIKKWIENQMKMRSCVVVLIGEYTQGRKWINYEIEQAWKAGKGIVGIYIHGLKDEAGDVLWYVVEVISAMGWTLEEVAQHNVEKLQNLYNNIHLHF